MGISQLYCFAGYLRVFKINSVTGILVKQFFFFLQISSYHLHALTKRKEINN